MFAPAFATLQLSLLTSLEILACTSWKERPAHHLHLQSSTLEKEISSKNEFQVTIDVWTSGSE